jgi:hypothetical protein
MVNMDIMLGLPEETVLIGFISLVKPEAIKSLVDYEQIALQNRKDLQAVDYRKQASRIAIKSARRIIPFPCTNRWLYCARRSKLHHGNQCNNIWCRTLLSASSIWKRKLI